MSTVIKRESIPLGVFIPREGKEGTSIPKDLLQKTIFAKGPLVPEKGDPLFSGISTGSISLASDCYSIIRAAQDLFLGWLQQNPTSSLFWLKKALLGKDSELRAHIWGMGSGINAVIGAAKLKQDLDNIAVADAIEDRRGALLGRVSMMKSGALIGAGLSFVTFRPLALIAKLKGIEVSGLRSPTLFGRVTYGLLTAGMVFYTLFFFLISAVFGMQAYDGFSFKKELEAAQTLEEKLSLLQGKCTVDPLKAYESLVNKHMLRLAGGDDAEKKANAAATEELVEEAFASGKAGLRELIAELGIEGVTEEKLQSAFLTILSKGSSGTNEKEILEKVSQELFGLGLQMRVQRIEKKKQAELDRILGKSGKESMATLKSSSNLLERVRKGDQEAIALGKSLAEKVHASASDKMKINTAVLGVLILGCAVMLASFAVFTGTALMIASTVVLIFSILVTVIDACSMIQSANEELPASYDKALLAGSTTLAACSFTALLALHLSGVVTMGVIPAVSALVILTLWISQNEVALTVMKRNELRDLEENPSLESFLKFFENEEGKEKVMEIFCNLPEELKELIQSELESHNNDLKEAALAAKEKVELLRKQHLEHLREELTPLFIDQI
ncbi:MAG: hypothetical protein KR126chlam1_00417 [Chlamydiae bacterium]|nr:hypothetical protein [Chlamydiota bacterium]